MKAMRGSGSGGWGGGLLSATMACLACLACSICGQAALAPTTASALSIDVSGNHFVDGKGKRVRLIGSTAPDPSTRARVTTGRAATDTRSSRVR